MQTRPKVLAILSLLTIFSSGLWHQMQAYAQDAQPGSFTNQLALLAIAPPPGNAGILDLYQIPGVLGEPASNVIVPGYPISAAWSPDGSSLAFIMITGQPGSDAPPSDFDIYRIDRQGASLMKLTDTPNCPEIGLTWSADSQALFFSGFCRDSQVTTFWRLDLVSGIAEQLGEVQWDGTWAVWSPDASKIAVLAPRKAEDGSLYDEVLLVSPDGQGIIHLANDIYPGYQLQQSTVLAWSPQSDWLAYATRIQKTEQGTGNQIILLRPDGSERRVLYTSQPNQECLNPLWSLDGQRLAFTCADNLFTIQSDGADLKNLTSPSAQQVIEYPAWAPGGASLAFISQATDGKRRLEIVQADGTQRHEIAEILAVQTFGLIWNPVGRPVSQEISLTPTNQDVSQVASPTISPKDVDQAAGLIPGSPDASQSVSPTSNDQTGLVNTSSTIWLLVLLLAAGGGGVFLLLNRAGKLPGLEKRKDQRKLRRERHERERAARILAEDAQPVSSIETGQTLIGHSEEQIQSDKGYEEPPEHPELLQQGINQIRSKDIHGGINTLRQYLESDPDDPTAWLWLGWASGLAKEYRTAERCFLRAGRLGSPQAGEALEWLNNLTSKR